MLGLSFNLLRCKGSENQASTVVASISLLRNRALPKLTSHGFPSVHPVFASISLLPALSPSYFPRLPVRPPYRHFHLARSFTTVLSQPISHAFLSVTLSSLPSRSFPTELSPSYFLRFPLRPPYRRFHLAPSQRSSPRAISHAQFPLRPPCRRFHLAPSQRSSPQPISHVLGEATAVMRDVALLTWQGENSSCHDKTMWFASLNINNNPKIQCNLHL